ncbi:MAG: hypothetical protein E7349_08380, partial [Clostridiales bacterium]|nr:hypothetical protein [Clostridiales bacterium]
MKNISKAVFSITYTDGSLKSKNLENFVFDDGNLVTEIACEKFGDYTELDINVCGSSGASVKYVDVAFYFSENFLNDDLLYFYNGCLTNDWVECRKYVGNTGVIGRDVTVMKNLATGEFFHVGYITANRFMTYIKFEQNGIVLRHFMEDKPIAKGKKFQLERILLSNAANESAFLERYCDRIAQIYNIKLDKPMPAGWCSWSCFYKDVDRRKVIDATNGLFDSVPGLNVLQLDDGWQDESKEHAGEWYEDIQKFPNGMKDFCEYLKAQGVNLGLWLAPTLPKFNSPFFDNLREELWTPPANIKPEVLQTVKNLSPRFDLGNPKFIERLKNVFRRLTKECGASYFKLDFLFNSFSADIAREHFYVYEKDYMIALYRKMITAIRETVGDECFLLACGAPILESVGIFDGSRIAQDIVWRKKFSKFYCWQIEKKCIKNTMLRYFYHDKLFYNDADGVILRDYDNGDGFNGSYHEVRAWATMVAMSGGVTLQNDINWTLSPARRKLFAELFPLNRIAAKPVDFFELPYPSLLFINYPSAKLLSLFNLDEEKKEYPISFNRLGVSGKHVIVNAWEKRAIGIFEDKYIETCLLPRSVEVYLVKKITDVPQFIYMDNNLFLGADMVESVYEDDSLKITLD